MEYSSKKGRNGKFNFNVALSMEDHEDTFSLGEQFQTINLLSKIAIEKCGRKYKHIRFGVLRLHCNL